MHKKKKKKKRERESKGQEPQRRVINHSRRNGRLSPKGTPSEVK